MKAKFISEYCELIRWRDGAARPTELSDRGFYEEQSIKASKELSIEFCLAIELAVNKFFASQGSDLRVGFDKSTYKFLATTP